MKRFFRNLWYLLFKAGQDKPNLPKRNEEAILTYRSGITCIVCGTKDIEITEQGLCEVCGNVIM